MIMAILLTTLVGAWLTISFIAAYSTLQLVAWNQSWFLLDIGDKFKSLLLAFLVFVFWPFAVIYSVATTVKERVFGR